MSNHNKLSQDTLQMKQKTDKDPPRASSIATAVTKNSPIGRNVRQNPTLGGRPSASTVSGEKERERGGGEDSEREIDRERDTGKYR